MFIHFLTYFPVVDFQFYATVVREDTWNNFYTPKFAEVLCPRMWLVLENVPCVLEKKVDSDFFFFGCSVLKMSIKPNFSIVPIRISLSYCLEDLSVDVSRVLKSFTIIVFPSIFPFMSVSICCMNLGAPVLEAYILRSIISSSWMDPFIIK